MLTPRIKAPLRLTEKTDNSSLRPVDGLKLAPQPPSTPPPPWRLPVARPATQEEAFEKAVRLPFPLDSWLDGNSGQRVICLSHYDSNDAVADLWSQAKSITAAIPCLADLEYRDRQEGHEDDASLKAALGEDCFTRTEVGRFIVVGIGANRKQRERVVRIAAAVSLFEDCDVLEPGLEHLDEGALRCFMTLLDNTVDGFDDQRRRLTTKVARLAQIPFADRSWQAQMFLKSRGVEDTTKA